MHKRDRTETAIGGDNNDEQNASKKLKTEQTSPPSSSSANFSPMTFITPWTSSTLVASPNVYPPIPEIKDPALAIAAVTHCGFRKKLTDLSYERLEWIGDAYMELIASELLYATFPDLSEGRLSSFRELLTKNATLSSFSLHYGLDKKAHFPAEFDLDGRVNGSSASEKKREKALGDIFEAYVGALIRSDAANGYKIAVDWLKCLWGPVLKDFIEGYEKGQGRDLAHEEISAKTRLEQMIVVPGVKIEYRDLSTKKDKGSSNLIYTVGCFMNRLGEEALQLGWGSGRNKKEAGQKAAIMAMENKKVIKKFKEEKEAYLNARAKQKEGEEGAVKG
ncbi:ribonuclease III domain-containing protein [Podospora fimiseda]|uniref:Ribonuclease III domain-containing protein n=1 Tax=Podospora fimiseda TaxID=252190 RepID=A0AAN7BNN6_9PEZI|nr:ribonuclease III domain-containing protein [Podospora fimiseda]